MGRTDCSCPGDEEDRKEQELHVKQRHKADQKGQVDVLPSSQLFTQFIVLKGDIVFEAGIDSYYHVILRMMFVAGSVI